MTTTTTLQTLTSLCRRRGFLFQSSEIYGGLASTWDYGPLGVELKNNVKRHWWQTFVWGRRDMVGLDAAILMHPEVWRASGHVENFTDPLVDCKNCNLRFRADHLMPWKVSGSNIEFPESGRDDQWQVSEYVTDINPDWNSMSPQAQAWENSIILKHSELGYPASPRH